jgi:hypothetical protein
MRRNGSERRRPAAPRTPIRLDAWGRKESVADQAGKVSPAGILESLKREPPLWVARVLAEFYFQARIVTDQYSSGKRIVVADLSASVIIHIFSLAVVSYELTIRLPSRTASSFNRLSPAHTVPQSPQTWRRMKAEGCCPLRCNAAIAPGVPTSWPRGNSGHRRGCEFEATMPPQRTASSTVGSGCR